MDESSGSSSSSSSMIEEEVSEDPEEFPPSSSSNDSSVMPPPFDDDEVSENSDAESESEEEDSNEPNFHKPTMIPLKKGGDDAANYNGFDMSSGGLSLGSGYRQQKKPQSTMSVDEKSYELPGLNRSDKNLSLKSSKHSSSEEEESKESSAKSPPKVAPLVPAKTHKSLPKRQKPIISPSKWLPQKQPLASPVKSPAKQTQQTPKSPVKKPPPPPIVKSRSASTSESGSGSSSSSSSSSSKSDDSKKKQGSKSQNEVANVMSLLESKRKASDNEEVVEVKRPKAPKKVVLSHPTPVAAIEIPTPESESDFSFSTNTDPSLAAKLAKAGIAPLPKSPGKRRVSFDGNKPKEEDNADDVEESDSYESFETASSDEFETDTEGNSKDPDGASIDELQPDYGSALLGDEGSDDYETDSEYYKETGGAAPPPPPLGRSASASNVKSTKAAASTSFLARPMSSPAKEKKTKGRRQPYENIPTLVDADMKGINPITPIDDRIDQGEGNLLGLSGWENEDYGAPEEEIVFGHEGNESAVEKKRSGMFGWLLGGNKKGKESSKTQSQATSPPVRKKSAGRSKPDPVYDPPEFDDGISQVTDRVFFPKPKKTPNPPPRRDANPSFPQMTPSELEREIQEEQNRFSIRSFRRTHGGNSIPALEDLDPMSVLTAPGDSEPRAEPRREKRNIKYALASLPVLSIPKTEDHIRPDGVKAALYDMGTESVDLDIHYDLDKPVPEFVGAPADPNVTNAILMQHALGAIPEDEVKHNEEEYYEYPAERSDEEVEYEEEEVVEEEFIEEEEKAEEAEIEDCIEEAEDPERPGAITMIEERAFDDDKSDYDRLRRRSIAFCIALIFLFAVTGVGIWLIIKYALQDNNRSNPNNSDTSVPPPGAGPSWGETPPALPPGTDPTSPEQIERDIIDTLSPYLPDGGGSFSDPNSPQSLAVAWMIQDKEVYSYDGERLATRYALATLYYSTNGDDWVNNELWLSDENECLWYSKVDPCSGGRYTQLRLGDNNLRGSIPEELSLLSNSLTAMDLGGILEDEIPFTIGELRLMTSLRLRGEELSGILPDSMKYLTNLLYLDLRRNKLQGTLSDNFLNAVTSIETLDLGENQFSGVLPTTIGKLSNALTWFSVGNNRLNEIPKELGDNTLLRYLDLDSNEFRSLPQSIERLSNLEILVAGNNIFGGRLLERIGEQLSNLKGLYLNNNGHTGRIPDDYGSLTKLTALDLSMNSLTGELPESMGQVSALRSFILRGNNLSGTIPSAMGSMSMLDTLRLDANDFVGQLPPALCDSFNEASSSYFADCRELACPCCNFCCNDATGECTCRFANSQPILCIP
jgi:hypothetical protein